MTPEGRVKALVNKAFKSRLRGYKFMPVQNGMGAPALDFFCCIDGRFVAIETKAPGKRLTQRQNMTAADIIAAGGRVFVVRDGKDLDDMINALSGP